MIHTVKGFGIVNKAEIDSFLELSCFFNDPADVGNLISGSSVFSKTSLNIWKFLVHVLLKPGLEDFEHYFTSVWDDSVMSNSATPWTVAQPGSYVHRILQARILEWVAIYFSRGSSPSRDWNWVSFTAGRFFTVWATREPISLISEFYWWLKHTIFFFNSGILSFGLKNIYLIYLNDRYLGCCFYREEMSIHMIWQ